MTDARRILRDEIPIRAGQVTADGGWLRVLSGADHGLQISVMQSWVQPGSGPRLHRHPHAEVFVVQDGLGTFDVDGHAFDASAGDIVIIPPNAWHDFIATGEEPLRLVAIHENVRAMTEFVDGTRRD